METSTAPMIVQGTETIDPYPYTVKQARAWLAMWKAMADGRWYAGPELAAYGSRKADIGDKAAREILRRARVAGLLDVNYGHFRVGTTGPLRKTAFYRRPVGERP